MKMSALQYASQYIQETIRKQFISNHEWVSCTGTFMVRNSMHQRCGVGLVRRTDRQGAPQHSDPPFISLIGTYRSGGGCPQNGQLSSIKLFLIPMLLLFSGLFIECFAKSGDPCDNPPSEAVILTPSGTYCPGFPLILEAEEPLVGAGIWSIISGSGVILSEESPTAFLDGALEGDVITVAWTVTNETCSSTTQIVIEIVEGFTVISNSPICEGADLVLTAVHPDLALVEWYTAQEQLLGTGLTITVEAADPALSGLLFVIAIDGQGCELYAEVEIVVDIDNSVFSLAGEDQFLCQDNFTILEGNEVPFGAGIWSVQSGTATFADAMDPQTFVSGLGVGENELVWTVSSGNACPAAVSTVTITVNAPELTIEPLDPVCEGSDVTLTASGSGFTTITWFDAQENEIGNTATVVLENIQLSESGLYFVIAVDEDGCEAYGEVEVQIDAAPLALTGKDQLLCQDNFTNLGANEVPFGTGMWSVQSGTATFEDAFNPETFVSGLALGQNVLIWTVSFDNACPAAVSTVTITVNAPELTIEPIDPVCEGSDVTLTASGSGFTTITWFDAQENEIGNTATVVLENIQLSESGLYFVIAVDEDGCEAYGEVEVQVDATPLALTGEDQLLCQDNFTNLEANEVPFGTGMWSVQSGTATFEDAFNPETFVSGLALGQNVLIWTVSFDNACPAAVSTVTITVNAPELTIEPIDPVCEGSDVTLTASGSGFTTITWFDAQENEIGNTTTVLLENVQPSQSGLYFVIAADADGCEAYAEVLVQVDAAPLALTGEDQLLCQDNFTNLGANEVPFGTGMWSVQSGTATFEDAFNSETFVSGLALGQNVLVWTVSFDNACPAAVSTVTITVNAPELTIEPLDPVCEGSDVTLTASGSGFTTITWFDAEENEIGNTTTVLLENVQPSQSGLYFVIAADADGCEAYAEVLVQVDAAPLAFAGDDQLLCDTNVAFLNAQSALGFDGIWSSIQGGGILEDTTSPSTSITNLSTGDNLLLWTVLSGNACPDARDTVLLIVSFPAVALSSNVPICEGSDLLLSASGNELAVISWFDPFGNLLSDQLGLIISNIQPENNGIYLFEYFTELGCFGNIEIEVTVDIQLLADAGLDQIVCASDAVLLSAGSPLFGSGSWQTIQGSGEINNPNEASTVVTQLSEGINTFVWLVDPSNSCGISTDTVQVFYGNPAGVIQSNLPLCVGEDLILEIEGNFFSNVWISALGLPLGDGNILQISAIDLGVENIFFAVISDTLGCEAQLSIEVIPDQPVRAMAGADFLQCFEDSTELFIDLPDGVTGSWSVISGASIINQLSEGFAVVSHLSPGANIFEWTLNSINSCPGSKDTVTIFYGNPFGSIIGVDSSCEGEDVQLSAQVEGADSYIWTFPDGGTSMESSFILSNVTTNDSGFYALTVIDELGCVFDTTLLLQVLGLPIANAGSDLVACLQDSFNLVAFLPEGTNGIWSILEGIGTISDPNSPNTTLLDVPQGSDITLIWTVESIFGQCINQDTLLVSWVSETPPAFAGEDQNICISDSIISLNAAVPLIPGGNWEVVSGQGVFLDQTSPSTTFTIFELDSSSTIKLRWSITDACHEDLPSSFDDLIIFVDVFPDEAKVLTPDTSICQQSTLLISAEEIQIGSGLWTLGGPGAQILEPSDAQTAIVSLQAATSYQIYWTVVNGICPPSRDSLLITVDDFPDIVSAGEDIIGCNQDSTILNAIPWGYGIGLWQVLNNQAIIADNFEATTAITNLPIGEATFVRLSIDAGSCGLFADTISILFDRLPSSSIILTQDTSYCNQDTISVAAHLPEVGMGQWIFQSGQGNIQDIFSFETTVLATDPSFEWTLVWEVSNGQCPSSSDTIRLVGFAAPDSASILSDFDWICADTIELVATPYSTGLGLWSLLNGQASFLNAQEPNTRLFGFENGAFVDVIWTISNGACPPSADTLSLSVSSQFIEANAGNDLYFCGATSAELDAMTPGLGLTGFWSILIGPGLIENPSNSRSLLSGLIPGDSTQLIWTVSSQDPCPDRQDTIWIYNLDGEGIFPNFLVNESPCVGDSVVIIDISDTDNLQNIQYLWSINGQNFSDRDLKLVFPESGPVSLTLQITVGDCINTSPEKEIFVLDCFPEDHEEGTYALLQAFPNPTSGPLIIDIDTDQSSLDYTIRVVNLSGIEVHNQSARGGQQLKIDLAYPGMYFVIMTTDRFQQIVRVLKI